MLQIGELMPQVKWWRHIYKNEYAKASLGTPINLANSGNRIFHDKTSQ